MSNKNISTITFKELVEFINSQPDDKLIEFLEGSSNFPTGCLLVHFLESKGYTNVCCGFSFADAKINGELIKFDIDGGGTAVQLFLPEFWEYSYNKTQSYKELKENLKEEYKIK